MKDMRTQLRELLAERILVLDGSWGVLIHRRELSEEEYRGERFAAHTHDVKGDPDILNLTAPEIVSEIHDAYFEAGADIATTNTFTATSIGQADYALEDAAAEMSLEGATARARRGGRLDGADTRQAALRRRLGRPAQRHALALAQGRGRRLPRGDLRPGAGGVRGADPRIARRRRRPPPDRDDLRHAQREGGDRRRARGCARASALALVHGDRQERPQPLGPDVGRVLDLGRARRAVHRRRQLLARRDRDAAVPRGARERRVDLRVVPSRTRGCRTPSGSTTSRPPTRAGTCARSPRTVS